MSYNNYFSGIVPSSVPSLPTFTSISYLFNKTESPQKKTLPNGQHVAKPSIAEQLGISSKQLNTIAVGTLGILASGTTAYFTSSYLSSLVSNKISVVTPNNNNVTKQQHN